MFYIALAALHDYLMTNETSTEIYCFIHRILKIRKNSSTSRIGDPISKTTTLSHPPHSLTTFIKYKTVVCQNTNQNN
jgi:hypothetical protein